MHGNLTQTDLSGPANNTLPQKGWHILDPLWEGDENVVESGLPHDELSPPWQLLLLGDISPTRHLKLLTGEPTEVDVIDMSWIGTDTDHIPELIRNIPGPRIRRQVWLRSASGNRLGYAVSWWQADHIDEYLKKKSIPIWENLSRMRAELYRDIQKIQYGHSATLEQDFDQEGPFWARYYFFFYQKKPLTLIYEVFSPFLRKYLGRCRTFSMVV